MHVVVKTSSILSVKGCRLHHSKVLHSLGIGIPVGKGTQGTTLVCTEQCEAVDVTCIDPSETATR